MKTSILNGKKILFFAPAFFDYELKIRDKMLELGAIVDMYDERSITSNWEKALLKVGSYIFEQKTNKYYQEIIKQIDKEYDFVFFY